MTCRMCDRPRKKHRTLCHEHHLAERREREAASNARLNEARRTRYQTDPSYRLTISARNKLHFYGLTPCQFTRMLIEQDGRCGICHTKDPGTKGWSVDHDHECCDKKRSCGNCVRALLCTKCNSGIAMFGDDVDKIRAAIDYIERHRNG